MSDSSDKNNISDEDRALWEAYIEDMRPSSQGGDMPEENFEALLDSEDTPSEENEGGKKKEILVSASENKENIPDRQQKRIQPDQLDRRTEEKLRKGKMPIEGRLDLHGMTQAQAHESLIRFVVGCYERGLRCILIITGKGKSKSTSDSWLSPSKGVLKENVPYWLSDNPLNNIVLKFFKAQPKDGGSGALYIYLKRKR